MGSTNRFKNHFRRTILEAKTEMRKLTVIKIGGNIIDNPDQLNNFLNNFSAINGSKILIHGGGKIATKLASDLGIKATLIDGRRVTNKETLDIVTMVYAGLINKNVVAALQSYGNNAIGLSGADGNCIKAIKRPVKTVDYGWVGDLLENSVNSESLIAFLNADFIPVFSAITHDGQGQLLNTNADTIASSIAVALSSHFETSLIYCFEKKGVLRDVNDDSSVVSEIKEKDFIPLQQDGTITDGMIPKLHNAFDAINKGVKEVLIGQASDLPLLKDNKFGSRILK